MHSLGFSNCGLDESLKKGIFRKLRGQARNFHMTHPLLDGFSRCRGVSSFRSSVSIQAISWQSCS